MTMHRISFGTKGHLLLLLFAAGCPRIEGRAPHDGGPDGELEGEVAARLVVPLDGARNVPANLERLVVAARSDPGAPSLEEPAGRPVPLALGRSEALACGEPFCAEWQILTPLSARATYQVTLGAATFHFETGEADTTPPALETPTLDFEGPCVRLRSSSGEPVTVELVDGAGMIIGRQDVASRAIDVVGVASAGPRLLVRLSDLAGNEATAEWPYGPARTPRIVITELLPNPVGPEPAQEWVELRNLGREAVSTEGLSIVAGMRSDPLPPARLAPGEYALLVGLSFEAQGDPDAMVPADALLLRLPNPTIGAGLRNGSGGPVDLVDAQGRLVSRYGGYLDFSPRDQAGTSGVRIDEQGCDRKENWMAARPSPGLPRR